MKIQNWAMLSSKEQVSLLARPAIANSETLARVVSDILKSVNQDGDAALVNLAKKFDNLTLSELSVTEAQFDSAINALDDTTKQAIDLAYDQIFKFHEAQVVADSKVETIAGVVCELRSTGIASVGLYIPGGSAPLPSTVLMLGIPAQIAKCKRVVIMTPPNATGGVTAEILYAAKKCGISEVYISGGAQAIGALAYGTETIPKVDKIFGPGNSFVTEAKQQVSQDVNGAVIDMPAGPSEVLVLADSYANPDFVAADLLSQAEHGPDSQVILVSDSQMLIEQTINALETQLADLPRSDIAEKALDNSRLILTNSLAQSVDVSNQYAPEHLIVQTNNAYDLLDKLENAASIFVGAYTPESAGDYASGTNHVLPTYGYSKVLSSLSLIDFTRRYTVQTITKQGIAAIGPAIETIAAAEGLDAHKNAVTLRLSEIRQEGGTL